MWDLINFSFSENIMYSYKNRIGSSCGYLEIMPGLFYFCIKLLTNTLKTGIFQYWLITRR